MMVLGMQGDPAGDNVIGFGSGAADYRTVGAFA
jgi:hypothetical protein